MQKIGNRWGNLNGEPPDGGFNQIVAAARIERILAHEPTLAELGAMAVSEVQGAQRGQQFMMGEVAAARGPEPLVRIIR